MEIIAATSAPRDTLRPEYRGKNGYILTREYKIRDTSGLKIGMAVTFLS